MSKSIVGKKNLNEFNSDCFLGCYYKFFMVQQCNFHFKHNFQLPVTSSLRVGRGCNKCLT